MNLEYISYENYKAKGYLLDSVCKFDCGFSCFNLFLQHNLDLWQEKLAGVTYFLIDKDICDKTQVIIYAYTTVSTIGLLSRHEDIHSYISGVEIKLFAIDRHFRGKTNKDGVKYSHVFFAILLQDLWSIAMSQISFKMIFLQSNTLGMSLYKKFGFIEVNGYVSPTDDDKIDVDDCVPMLCEITDEIMYMIFE